ncbi:hypothetical protein [Bosea sp. (in: a-proteobacteria)]
MKSERSDGTYHTAERIAPGTLASELIGRLRQILLPMGLDCACRDMLGGALERFDLLERRREARRQLAQARDHKDRILALLSFLSDLDSVTEIEKDRTVFEEMALLFLEIGRSAEAGAAALREL